MMEARDIELLSISFTAGVVTSAVFHPGHPFPALAACAAAIVFCAFSKGRCTVPIAALFYFAGLFCHSSDALCVQAGGLENPLSIDWLCRLIDSAGFEGRDTAGLLKAVLTGDRSALRPEVKDAFRGSGASHILALSGLHLGIIYLLVRRSLAFVGNTPGARLTRSLSCIVLCGAYTLMTGGGPSICRAFLFILSSEIASLNPDRERRPLSALCLALLLQLAVTPRTVTSLGFQLSYLAMLGIFLVFPTLDGFYPKMENKTLGRLDIMGRIWTSMALSVSCQIFTGPLVWLRFHTFPEFFLLTNLLALPLTELTILLTVPALGLSAAGLCPDFLLKITDFLTDTLTGCLFLLASD